MPQKHGEVRDPENRYSTMQFAEDINFAFKLSDVFGYTTRIISDGCYQVLAPERHQD